jgi:autophagy-related protein 11
MFASFVATEDAYEELAEQFRALQQSNIDQQALFQADRNALETEVTHLRGTVKRLEVAEKEDQDRVDSLERQLHSTRSQIETEVARCQKSEARNTELLADVEHQRQAHADALAENTEQARVIGLLTQELAQVRTEYQDVKTLEGRHAQRIAVLLEEQANTIRNLEEARSKGLDMESQVQTVYLESEEMKRALLETSKETDRLLRLQASEHDRIIRDHIAEADGDRAVLEHQFSELKATVDNAERQLNDVRSQLDMAQADAQGLREELQRLEHELREGRHVEQVLRSDLRDGRASQSDYDQRLEDSSRLIAQLLDVAIAFRNSHVKAMTSAQALVSHPVPPKTSPNPAPDPVFSPVLRHGTVGPHDEPSPIDPSDPATALEILRTFDHDHFLETISRTGSTIRKWQKQCKEYRERAKGKISFRNFTKGDLALFLPTRNSVSKPWAAFNGLFPS